MVQIYNARHRPPGQPVPVLFEPVAPKPKRKPVIYHPAPTVDQFVAVPRAGLRGRPPSSTAAKPPLAKRSMYRKPIYPRDVIAVVCRITGIGDGHLCDGMKRKQGIVWARGIAAVILRQRLDLSLPQIGALMNQCDHTSAKNALDQHPYRMKREWYRRVYLMALSALNMSASDAERKIPVAAE